MGHQADRLCYIGGSVEYVYGFEMGWWSILVVNVFSVSGKKMGKSGLGPGT